ncbi:ABC transporter ATP-binding protein [Microvirga zambiensis]|uniref:ABC transporter ATP-binding protein n=1 Tax=Microvirga zambiensis TaxID=1402137 RepID=UPI00191F253D|nr:ABC transporter ATP-binding protein [Microvirga zambiensis]
MYMDKCINAHDTLIGSRGAPVSVAGLRKNFKKFAALDDLSFDVKPGKITALLGPSGCGKTTALRCIAGLEVPDDGEIKIGNTVVTSISKGTLLPPNKRNLGMVFQSYAIWPHMTVGQNVGYPLKVRGRKGSDIERQVEETLSLVGLGGYSTRPAGKLSGGQQQRVALARAIIARPSVILFDEPLSNLDAKLRARMRFELLRLQREVGITSVFVTHDQAEAMAIADELIVMNRGRIEQRGDARSIYMEPASEFVADFIGVSNALEAIVVQSSSEAGITTVRLSDNPDITIKSRARCKLIEGQRCQAFVRPESLRLSSAQTTPAYDDNILEVTVLATQYLGNTIEVEVRLGNSELRLALEPHHHLAQGDRLHLRMAAHDCILLEGASR